MHYFLETTFFVIKSLQFHIYIFLFIYSSDSDYATASEILQYAMELKVIFKIKPSIT